MIYADMIYETVMERSKTTNENYGDCIMAKTKAVDGMIETTDVNEAITETRNITKLQYKPWNKVKQTTFSLSEDGTAIRYAAAPKGFKQTVFIDIAEITDVHKAFCIVAQSAIQSNREQVKPTEKEYVYDFVGYLNSISEKGGFDAVKVLKKKVTQGTLEERRRVKREALEALDVPESITAAELAKMK